MDHVDICTSLICLRLGSDHPAYVSRSSFLFSLNLTAKMPSVQRYGGSTGLSYQSHRPRGSQAQAPRSIVCSFLRIGFPTVFRACDLESGIAILHAHWGGSFCKITNTAATKTNILVTFITDWVLLSLMFIGLLRWENANQKGGIWWLLFTQVKLHACVVMAL